MTAPDTSDLPPGAERRRGSRLSWPPPGLERMQGHLWRVTGLLWIGAAILVLPLMWALGSPQPFWSLGPLEDHWRVGLLVAVIGMGVTVVGFYELFSLLRGATRAAGRGFGRLTLLEVMTDLGRDTGFLIQGKRHFSLLESETRAAIVRERIRGTVMVLFAALWMVVGFAVAVLLAARGFVTPSGTWLLTAGPTVVLLVWGAVVLLRQGMRVRAARREWMAREGAEHARAEVESWVSGMEAAGEHVVLGAGPADGVPRFSSGAATVVALLVLAIVPTVTVTITGTLGPVLADIAVPTFLSVQEKVGATEVLRDLRLPTVADVRPAAAGAALHNLEFVGITDGPESLERTPTTRYETPWFPSEGFPDQFSETVASDLMAVPLRQRSADEAEAMRSAAAHPAQEEFNVLAHAGVADVAGGRLAERIPVGTSFQSLPWPHFAELRIAGLAHVAKAAVELDAGQRARAEETLRELISTGLVLIDNGPTLIDNLVGVVLANMGGDALETYYRRVGRDADAAHLASARAAARAAARTAAAGNPEPDVRSLLRGIPDLVENEEALRGLRWEYLATFNTLAPCINLHKMVFGPDETYDAWRARVRDSLVRVEGERRLFDVAGSRNASDAASGGGFLPGLLRLTLGSRARPGSCAGLISSLEGV